MKRKVINIRGAVATGKTESVRQYCNKVGFVVEKINTGFAILPVTILNCAEQNIVVLGDYSKTSNCLGPDRFKNGTKDIMDAISCVYEKYNPNLIIYEHMISSHLFRSSYEISKLCNSYGYDFCCIQLYCNESVRLERLVNRSGTSAKTKNFEKNNGDRVLSASYKLKKAGINVKVINTECISIDDMWRIVDCAVRQEIG